MRVFQIILAIITVIMALGMFGFNFWINANFGKCADVPQCFLPMSIITTVLVVILVITVFIRK